jgi:hypothetical protein
MPPFLGPFSSLARFALTGYLPIITPWEGYGVNPVLNNQTGFTTKTRLVRLEKKTRPGERMGASSPSGLGVRSGAPSQVPRHVAANGPAGPGPAPVAHGAPSPTPQAPGPSPSL